ncbi:acyltransferase [Pseudoalteromonas sp. SR41-7]|uniref:acyltransferase family protein n=1 Tax=Pseudoalteromonas sp. SR41-7 TaxID=2760947 RepID=UPI0016027067|nr:acyltransferase [Pseudoalteromonas sp. SR41-7]MBB1297211.1 acyltransferase [Pseudoalteromonas sp. SR41-7]
MINSIQYLRGIAAILVVYYHSTIKSVQNNLPDAEVFSFGQAGVDLFFIISGFIICFSTDKHSFSAVKFLKSRILRIIPLYWFFTLLALVIFIVLPDLVNSSGGETVVFKSFFLLPTEDKYLVRNGWTLSYEFYFYFIFALFSLFFIKRNLVFIPLILLPMLGMILDANFYFDSYLLEFAMGVISYNIFKNNLSIKYDFLLLLFILIVFFTCSLESKACVYGLPMWFLFHGSLVLDRIINSKDLLKRTKKLLFKLGDSSYSLYLSHAFSLVILNKLVMYFFPTANKEVYLFILTSVSIIIGHFVYIFVELNINLYFKRLFNKK